MSRTLVLSLAVLLTLAFAGLAKAEVWHRIEIYSCLSPVPYLAVQKAAEQSYQAAHQTAEQAVSRGCTKLIQYQFGHFSRFTVEFVGVVQHSHLEIKFHSPAWVQAS